MAPCEEPIPFPGRETQIAQLERIRESGGLVSSVYVYGHASTGKSAVVTHVFGERVVVDCCLFSTSELVFSAIQRVLLTSKVVVVDHVSVKHLRIARQLIRQAQGQAFTVVVIGSPPLRWIETTTPPLLIYFPAYTAAQTRLILERDCPSTNDLALWSQFVELTQSVLQAPCRDLNELRHVVALLFPKYIEPVQKGRLRCDEKAKLYAAVGFYFKEVLDQLYTRRLSRVEFESSSTTLSTAASAATSFDMDLPYNTTYLLLASFIASYNPKGLDVRFFARASEGKRKRTTSLVGKKSKVPSTKLRQQLLGPKAFPIERMLAIFYRIKEDTDVDEELESLVDVQMQISSLITKGLLLRMSNVARIDEVKCKVNIGLETAYTLAARVRFDLSKYLHDFKA
ncbi:UNVERIFIED_CONTAM: Origin recognition complex subunit 5 [Siphonaria sp. JEL0065]|nr:Origin recognition complex subunit 5 [Siphonaria sp. JEL0065]